MTKEWLEDERTQALRAAAQISRSTTTDTARRLATLLIHAVNAPIRHPEMIAVCDQCVAAREWATILGPDWGPESALDWRVTSQQVPSDAMYALASILADPDHVQCLGSPDQQASCIMEGLAQRGLMIVRRPQ